MAEIQQLSTIGTITSADQIPIYSSADGITLKASINQLSTYITSQLEISEQFLTQYSAPSASGFSVQIEDDVDNIHLILTPTGTFANGEIVLPSAPVDKQEVLVNCTQVVSTLVVDGGTKTVTGEPSSLAANGFFKLRFDAVTAAWYRVG
jgi:hypothetical protein